MSELYNISNAFKELDLLTEDTFKADDAGIDKLRDFMDGDQVDEITIIDPEAETFDDVKESYIGKVILNCGVCQSKFYKDKEDIVIDEETQLANVGEECPYCTSADGFEIVGQVAEYCPDCVEGEHDDHTDGDEDDDEDAEVEVNVSEEEDLQEDLGSDLAKYQKWVDYDMKKYGKVSDKTKQDLDKANLTIVKDKYGAYQVVSKEIDGKALKESVESVEVKTDTDKVCVDTEGDSTKVEIKPRDDFEDEAEMITPVDDEVKDEIEAEQVSDEEVSDEEVEDEDNFEDVDFDEFDEESFDELGERYLKKVYENVKSYKTSSGSMKNDKLKLEGVITFNSGKQAKTTFLFEGASILKNGTLKLIGENKNFSDKKNAFGLRGRVNGNKLMVESFNYNYIGKDAATGQSKKLYGTIRKTK